MKIEIHSVSDQVPLNHPVETLIARAPKRQDFESFKNLFALNIHLIKRDIQLFGENAECLHDELDEFMYQKSLPYIRTLFSSESGIDEVTSSLIVSVGAFENTETEIYRVGLMGFSVSELLPSLRDCGFIAAELR